MELKKNFEGLFREYINRDSEVLDLGAGRLPYKAIINKYSDKYYSLDFVETHPDLDYIGTTSKTGLESGRFDLLFCNQVLEHVPDPLESFREIKRVLKPGGIAIISTPFLMELHNEPYDYYRYTKYALKNLSEEADFEVLKLYEVGGVLAILSRYLSKIMIFCFYIIPIVKYPAILFNVLIQKLMGLLDKYIGFKGVFPNVYILVLRKSP